MRLPSINPNKYYGAVARQKATLSGQGTIWHPVLSVDQGVLARRREKLMKYRAKNP